MSGRPNGSRMRVCPSTHTTRQTKRDRFGGRLADGFRNGRGGHERSCRDDDGAQTNNTRVMKFLLSAARRRRRRRRRLHVQHKCSRTQTPS